MKPAPFAYLRPTTLDEALAALAEHGAGAKVLAGGQSLVPLLSMRLAAPEVVVDVNRVPGLDGIDVDDAGVGIGALVRHARLEADAAAARVQPLLARALRLVAHPTIRNQGTTVGSIAHADAAAEMPMVLRLLEGAVTAASVRGERTIEAADLFIGPLQTCLEADELLIRAWTPALPARSGVAVDEVSRRHGDYALVGVAAVVAVGEDGAVESVRAGFLSVADVPTVADLSEAFADGTVSSANLKAAADIASAATEPDADVHATADYRAHLLRVLTRRVVGVAYADVAARAGLAR